MTDAFVVGRDRELAQLRLSIGPPGDGLRLTMLSGPSGLGKTTLSVAATADAADRGFRTATIRGRAGSLSTPFAPFIESMPEFASLLTLLGTNASIDLEQAGIGLVTLLAQLTADRPLMLVIDDAQALDESSIALLPYLSGVSEGMDLSLFFVEQTDAIDVPSSYRSYIDGLLARRVVGHLELGPMEDAGIRQIVANELELASEDEVPATVVERAGGNPWFAKELAHSVADGTDDIPTTIAAAATSRLHSLDDTGQDIVLTISLCPDGAHVGWLEGLSDQRPRHFVRTMEAIAASGLVREEGDILTIAHPLMQQSLVDELSSAMRRAIHLELADVIDQTQADEVVSARARGYHLGRAGRRDDSVAQYLRAADSNEVGGQLHEAYADLVLALDVETRSEQRIDLLRRSAAMALQLGLDSAMEHWTDLGRLAAASGDNELYGYALFQQYWTSNNGTANDRLHRAASLGLETYGWSARAAATLARMDGDLELAISHDERAIEIARTRGDRLLEALALEKLASCQADMGRGIEAIATYRTAIQSAIAIRMHDWAVSSWGCLASTLLDQLEVTQALGEMEAAERYVDDLDLNRIRPALLAWKADTIRAAGDLTGAYAVVVEATNLLTRNGAQEASGHYGTFLSIIQADIANEIGSADATMRADSAHAAVIELGFASWELETVREQARAIGRRSGMDAALPLLVGIEGSDEPTFIASTALWMLRFSVLTDSAAGIARVREIRTGYAGWSASARSIASRDEIDATLAVLDGAGLDAMAPVLATWSDAGCALDALRVNAVTGAIALRRGDKEAAKTYLHAAKSGLATCGASADADLVAALLRQTGARSRATSRTTSVGPLTKRELEIARLVAGGLKNSEVAGTLFLAEKTVAAHLSNIYGKVEVRSRVQLGQWIRENDPEFEAIMANAG